MTQNTLYLKLPQERDHPSVQAVASLDNETEAGAIFLPGEDLPGDESPGCRIRLADVRIWDSNWITGTILAEAKMDATAPQVGYCVAAWSQDADAHRRLLDGIRVWLAQAGLEEGTELVWINTQQRG